MPMKTHATHLAHTLMLLALCFSTPLLAQPSASTAIARAAVLGGKTVDIGAPPKVVTGPIKQSTRDALDVLLTDFGQSPWNSDMDAALSVIADSGDPRLAWVVTDLLRFVSSPELNDDIAEALNKLLDTKLRGSSTWHASVTRLIAWDIPAPPDYLTYKRAIFTGIFPEWGPLFVDGDIDWRHVSWGGVRIDDRPFDTTDDPCNCIPAADNPEVSTAKEARWLDDDAIVFGISINGEHRAYPRRIMEVREMVNDTLGGRDLGIPYCTLCGSAQAWFTDDLPEGVERPVLRTSGMLIRSNKVMYDLTTHSVMDTFLGTAVTGPLAERGFQLKQATVVTTTWADWKAEYPDTTVLVEHLALGRDFDFRNGRDASGPIFPIGNVDERLGIQEDVLGVVTKTGKPIAFHVPSLIKALDSGKTVSVDGVQVVLSAGGVRAVDDQGQDLGTHQAFWFAWSQFHKDTALWPES